MSGEQHEQEKEEVNLTGVPGWYLDGDGSDTLDISQELGQSEHNFNVSADQKVRERLEEERKKSAAAAKGPLQDIEPEEHVTPGHGFQVHPE